MATRMTEPGATTAPTFRAVDALTGRIADDEPCHRCCELIAENDSLTAELAVVRAQRDTYRLGNERRGW
jgi:hypothetical protein